MVNPVNVNLLCRIGRHQYCDGRVARDGVYYPCECPCHNGGKKNDK